MSDTFTYTFFGKVIPERVKLTIIHEPLKIKFAESGTEGEARVYIQLSQIVARLTCSTEIDTWTLKTIMEDCIRLQVDILSYLYGCSFNVEITSMIDSQGNIPVVYGVSLNNEDNVEVYKNQRPKSFSDIFQLYSDKKSEYLRRCLASFREGLGSVKDSAQYCYRAIESLKHFFIDECNANQKTAWGILRQELNVNEEDIRFIDKYATPQRHGETMFISHSVFMKIIEITWDVIDKFVIYACDGYRKPS